MDHAQVNYNEPYLFVSKRHRSSLLPLYALENLLFAESDEKIWVKGFEVAQYEAMLQQPIVFSEWRFSVAGKLYQFGRSLPDMKTPQLNWLPIKQLFEVEWPIIQSNRTVGLPTLKIGLIPSTKEQNAGAQKISIDVLEEYLLKNIAFRTQDHQWTLLNGKEALIVGNPLLPLVGTCYWKSYNHWIPLGYELNYPEGLYLLDQKENSDNESFFLWRENDRYAVIEKEAFSRLSLASFRLTLESLNQPHE